MASKKSCTVRRAVSYTHLDVYKRQGKGEIIKHGLIKNANYFIWLKENEAQIAALDLPTVGEMRCV